MACNFINQNLHGSNVSGKALWTVNTAFGTVIKNNIKALCFCPGNLVSSVLTDSCQRPCCREAARHCQRRPALSISESDPLSDGGEGGAPVCPLAGKSWGKCAPTPTGHRDSQHCRGQNSGSEMKMKTLTVYFPSRRRDKPIFFCSVWMMNGWIVECIHWSMNEYLNEKKLIVRCFG